MCVSDSKFKKIVMWFRKQFPEFSMMSDEECFAFSCFIKEERIKTKRKNNCLQSY